MVTDKALAVMTPAHRKVIYHLWWVEQPGADKQHISDVLGVVAELVAHPERLAGEDEVVVKRAEIEDMGEKIAGVKGEDQSDFDLLSDMDHMIERWLAGSPTAQESGK